MEYFRNNVLSDRISSEMDGVYPAVSSGDHQYIVNTTSVGRKQPQNSLKITTTTTKRLTLNKRLYNFFNIFFNSF